MLRRQVFTCIVKEWLSLVRVADSWRKRRPNSSKVGFKLSVMPYNLICTMYVAPLCVYDTVSQIGAIFTNNIIEINIILTSAPVQVIVGQGGDLTD